MKLINTHKQKTRPIGRIANTKSNLALSVRSGAVNETRPSFYVMIVKHFFEIIGGPTGIRTPITTLKESRPNH